MDVDVVPSLLVPSFVSVGWCDIDVLGMSVYLFLFDVREELLTV